MAVEGSAGAWGVNHVVAFVAARAQVVAVRDGGAERGAAGAGAAAIAAAALVDHAVLALHVVFVFQLVHLVAPWKVETVCPGRTPRVQRPQP